VDLLLSQPRLRREWELRRNGEVVARLRVPVFRRGAEVALGGERIPLKPQRVLELGGRRAEWKRLGRQLGSGFVGPDGETLARGKLRTGLTRTTGELEVADDLPEQDALLAAALTAYLLIRKADDTAGVVAASVAATSGGG
jgi:hypothetical protein